MAETIKKFLGTEGVQQLITSTRAEIAAGDSKALADAKSYADSLADNYDGAGVAATKVQELADGQVKTNTDAIAVLNGDANTDGSVDKKIAAAKSELNATISGVEGKADAAQADADALETDMGNVDNLSTTNKTVVGAINEVLAAVGTGGTAAVVTITTDTTSEDALKSYTVKQGTTTVGVIDIPKDMVVQSGEVVTNPEGQAAGTYIKLVLANATNDEIYVNVGTLVDVYKAKANATQVQLAIDSSTREISASIVAGSITATELAENAVVTAKIADGNVTKAKLSTELQASIDKADAALDSAKEYADGLNAAMDTRVQAVEGKSHEHTNKTLLDTYTQTEANLADAVAKKHEHSNKAVLDGITADKVSAWDAAESNAVATAAADATSKANKALADAKSYADGLNTAMDTRVAALEDVTYTEITAAEVEAMFNA